MSNTYKGLLFALSGYFIFSICDIIGKQIQHLGYAPFQTSFYFSFTACILLFIFSNKLGGISDPPDILTIIGCIIIIISGIYLGKVGHSEEKKNGKS